MPAIRSQPKDRKPVLHKSGWLEGKLVAEKCDNEDYPLENIYQIAQLLGKPYDLQDKLFVSFSDRSVYIVEYLVNLKLDWDQSSMAMFQVLSNFRAVHNLELTSFVVFCTHPLNVYPIQTGMPDCLKQLRTFFKLKKQICLTKGRILAMMALFLVFHAHTGDNFSSQSLKSWANRSPPDAGSRTLQRWALEFLEIGNNTDIERVTNKVRKDLVERIRSAVKADDFRYLTSAQAQDLLTTLTFTPTQAIELTGNKPTPCRKWILDIVRTRCPWAKPLVMELLSSSRDGKVSSRKPPSNSRCPNSTIR